MGHTTFEPALAAGRWPWPNLEAVRARLQRPNRRRAAQADSDPVRLFEKARVAHRGGWVLLVGGPKTTETYRSLGALDRVELVVLPLFLGDGMRLTPPPSVDYGLTLARVGPLPEGSVEIVYAVT